MSGFPTRFNRQTLGPTLRDQGFPINPESDIPAAKFNAAFWQLAGLNLVCGRAIIAAEWNGSSFDITYQQEAWNPKGTQTRPALARGGTGDYTLTFASTYNDETDTAVSMVLGPPRAGLLTTVTSYANRREIFTWIDPAAPLVVEVRIFDSGGTARDEPFWLEVL